jgi:uncharacterized protein HemX
MAAEVGYDASAAALARRPAAAALRPLRLAPAPRTASPTGRELAYALTLGLVLGLGVLGVLVLNTLMQQQARTIDAQQAALDTLALRQQTLQVKLDAADNPRALARRAQALHMKPAGMLTPLAPAPPTRATKPARAATHPPAAGHRGVSARGWGTPPNHAG